MAIEDADSLIARERALIADLNIDRPAWRFQRGRRGGTISYASFTYALSMPDAPVALAMLRAYAEKVGLPDTDRWSVSAMPSWAGATELQRFATISSANIELFYVWFESRTGEVADWGIRLPADEAEGVPAGSESWRDHADNGDVSFHGETLSQLLDVLDELDALGALSATYERRQGPRRRDWHNPYLGALLGTSSDPVNHDEEPESPEDIEFERRYIQRLTTHRLHQAPLRAAALKRYGARCMYCGLAVLEILEAAHIIPDSEGGAASTENIRVLCANHHMAFDAKLIILVDGELVPAPGAPEVAPLPAREAAV